MKNAFLLFTFAAFQLQAFATDFYVSTTGSNGNDGSLNNPWLTLQYSIDQLQPGDVLHVKAGVFYEKFNINVSGMPGSPIVIMGESGAILDGTGQTGQIAMINIEDQSHVTVSYLEIRNNAMNDAQGISISGAGTGIVIRNNQIHDIHFSANAQDVANENTNAQPIIVLGTNPNQALTEITINDNIISNCRLGYSEAMALNGNVSNFFVFGNFIHEVSNIGIAIIGHEGTSSNPTTDQARNGNVYENTLVKCRSPYAACAGIYVDGGYNILIERNSTRENNYGIEVGCEHPNKSAAAILVRNNIICFNDYTGMQVGGYDFGGLSGKVEQVQIYNNTFFRNDSLYDGNGELLISYLETGTFQNNIFYTNDQARAITVIDTASGLGFDYNLYYTVEDASELFETTDGMYNMAGFQQLGFDTHSLFDDPLFGAMSNTSADDLYFSMGSNFDSPAIDHGNPNGNSSQFGATDFFNAPRVWNSRVDIGASELWVVGIEEVTTKELVAYPNPATDELHVSQSGTESYTIYDLLGNNVQSGSVENAVISIDQLSEGAYLIHLNKGKETIVTRFIKAN